MRRLTTKTVKKNDLHLNYCYIVQYDKTPHDRKYIRLLVSNKLKSEHSIATLIESSHLTTKKHNITYFTILL